MKLLASAVLILVVALGLSGCYNLGDRRQPIPEWRVPGKAGEGPRVLVVVLPGRADNTDVMREYGVAQAIQAGWPEADVVLTGATLAYYLDGRLAQRVHGQFIEPARNRGYETVVLMGASMGGMGTLLVDEAFPEAIDHLVLMAPYLGRKRVIREVDEAGGVLAWSPGPKPDTVDRGNFDRELLWRRINLIAADPALKSRVWLAYGREDRLARVMPLLEPALDADQVLVRQGGHKWVVWNEAATEIFARLKDRSAAR
ncbi:alpha/beta hydrolase [Pseudomarimonas salicorniae]|uniref:Lysophospholipase n=1 Tax=Pseudomarimonas salicorniae TaxID=2933270 RepID=A0ABT0GFS4_9GAMM|nr:alpha/beta hydrolase [Lysobacter sp. CAU 1642]MCK7593388.1 lysophospholipase [Lysobacter sp. CAU 1642]